VKTLALVTGILITPLAVAETFEFRFWPPSATYTDPRVSAIHDGPCGPVATARVQRMPQHSKKEPLAPERVLELDSRGEAINLWRVPVDSLVLGVSGQQLSFRFSESVFRVGTDGVIARDSVSTFPAPVEVPACRAFRHFGDSAYAACWRHQDLASGKPRLLAYEGPCT
jgi:hypothetical protein